MGKKRESKAARKVSSDVSSEEDKEELEEEDELPTINVRSVSPRLTFLLSSQTPKEK